MITPLSVSKLLGNTPPEEQVSYLIPMYQRNYAWEEAEIIQLIEDVLDYQPKKKRNISAPWWYPHGGVRPIERYMK